MKWFLSSHDRVDKALVSNDKCLVLYHEPILQYTQSRNLLLPAVGMDRECASRDLASGRCWPTRFAAALFVVDTLSASVLVRQGAGGAPVAKIEKEMIIK